MGAPSQPTLEIRQICEADFPSWLPLWKAYQSFYKAAIADQVTRVIFSRMLDPQEPTFAALGFYNGEVVGLVHWIFHRSNWSIGNYCYLQDLYVETSVRGKGIGRALIEHVYAAAQSAECSRVYWLTHETNSEAMLLYDRLADKSGFIQYRKLFGQ